MGGSGVLSESNPAAAGGRGSVRASVMSAAPGTRASSAATCWAAASPGRPVMALLWPRESTATGRSPRPNPTLLPGVMACSSHWVLPRLGLVRHCYVGWRRRKVTTVDERDWLAERFQAHRPPLRAVGSRMLSSLTQAEDAVHGPCLPLIHRRTVPRQ